MWGTIPAWQVLTLAWNAAPALALAAWFAGTRGRRDGVARMLCAASFSPPLRQRRQCLGRKHCNLRTAQRPDEPPGRNYQTGPPQKARRRSRTRISAQDPQEVP
eukprot:6211755-Pleurochrysis_carterae.AAC.2